MRATIVGGWDSIQRRAGYKLHLPGNVDGFHGLWLGTSRAEAIANLAAINARREELGLSPL